MSACRPTFDHELALLKRGYRFVAGLDEAGRGAWAGPVVAAAVIFPAGQASLLARLNQLHDSKKLTAASRDAQFEIIQAHALSIGVGCVEAAEVDRLNVVAATRLAMQQALARLSPAADYLLIDHLSLPALATPQAAYPKADSLSLSVAAASVIAKVTRDRLMIASHATYPGYAFHRHKGYGTREHQAALQKLGPCHLHRRSYKPIQALFHS